MIVPTMTLEEIRKEIEKDYPILLRKMVYVSNDLEKKLSKAQKIIGFERFYEYFSKYKNQWIYSISINKEITEFEFMLLYHNGRGHAAIAISPKNVLVYHTGHFFERFNERCKLGLKTIDDIIRAYMKENNTYDMRVVEEIEPGISKVFCVIQSGIMLGMFNKKLNLYKANTFLSNNMLNTKQKEMEYLDQIQA